MAQINQLFGHFSDFVINFYKFRPEVKLPGLWKLPTLGQKVVQMEKSGHTGSKWRSLIRKFWSSTNSGAYWDDGSSSNARRRKMLTHCPVKNRDELENTCDAFLSPAVGICVCLTETKTYEEMRKWTYSCFSVVRFWLFGPKSCRVRRPY